MTHELKTDSAVFQASKRGDKTYEVRKADRAFEVGDFVVLKETRYTGQEMSAGAPLEYTGDEVTKKITHVLKGPIYGLAEGWLILSVR